MHDDWRHAQAQVFAQTHGSSERSASSDPDSPSSRPKASPAVGTELRELPIYAHRDRILEHVRTHRVTHIQGETGCGKSTQVPKYIMQDCESRSTETKIVVTQPRRMAAITLAKRCASELGEELGRTVGYKISGDSVSGRLCFATTGFLLQVLVNQPEEFGTYTHVVLDEVHERSVDADLLTMLLKLLMQCYSHVKLVVMSATLQAHLFADYFACVEEGYMQRRFDTPKLDIKPLFVGVRTFPVEQIFLDEIDDNFDIEGGMARKALDTALKGFQELGGNGKGKGGKGKGGKSGRKAKDSGLEGAASGFKRTEPKIVEGLDVVCKNLVQQLARETCTIIVFLPGIADITSFYETLAPLDTSRAHRSEEAGWTSSEKQNGSVALKIFPMHSLIPREEQEEVFKAPPPGICHVVLASNIAESSLTLPSVCAVIDMALRRSIEYDARRLMSCLVTTWCSKSSCRQRSGRSGRTMPGRAVRMVTRSFFEREMPDFDPPEMLSAPLTKLYLQAKQLCTKLMNMRHKGILHDGIEMDLSTPTNLLGQLVQPPSIALVEAAITELAAVGALDQPTEEATISPIGYIAMALPCELRLCRLIYFGLMLQVPADAIAMVAGLTAADPFSAPSLMVLKDEKEYCKKLERSFEARLWCDRGRHSEPLMLRELFSEWIHAGAPRGSRAIGGFARDWNIIPKKFEAVASEAVDLSTRICKLLKPGSSPYIAVQRLLAAMRFHIDKREELVNSALPSNSEYSKIFHPDINLMRALLACSFSDQMMVHLKPRWEAAGGKKHKEQEMVATMKKRNLDLTATVVLMQPPAELKAKNDAWTTEENYQKLCEAICGEQAQKVYYDEKEKLLYFDFTGKTTKKNTPERPPPCGWRESDPIPLLEDVHYLVHRFHQFGAGRWKFTVENPLARDSAEEGAYSEMLEVIRPVQPFLLNWEVLQHQGDDGKKGGKKPEKVKAMPDWRNPLGFACDVRPDITPAREHLGVCASIQGLEAGNSAFVAGATALGMNHFPLLLTSLDPVKWDLQWGFDTRSGEVCAVRIMHFEFYLPPETITADVLWKVNQFRAKVRDALTGAPASLDARGAKGKGAGRGPPSGYIPIGDIRQAMEELLEEIWDEPYPVVKAKAIRWGSGAAADDADQNFQVFKPLAEDLIPVTSAARLTKAEMKAANKNAAKEQQGQKAKQTPKVPEYTRQLPLGIGDSATLHVNFGKFQGSHTVKLVAQEEKGWRVKHDKDGFEEVVKQRDINSGKLALTLIQ